MRRLRGVHYEPERHEEFTDDDDDEGHIDFGSGTICQLTERRMVVPKREFPIGFHSPVKPPPTPKPKPKRKPARKRAVPRRTKKAAKRRR